MLTILNQSIWGDEGFSAILSMKSLPEILKIIANDTSPPLWNITEWLVFNTLGTAEVYIRGLAFLYFSLTVFFTYKIGALLWDKKTGLAAAVLTFLNPFFFIYAFEGRMYSIMAMGVAGSMYFFLKILALKGKEAGMDKFGYVFFTLWAMYSHHFAMFVLIVQGLWFVWEFIKGERKVALKIFKLFIFVGIGYMPWVVPLYNQTTKVGGGFWLGTPGIKEFIEIIGKYLGAGIEHKLKDTAVLLAFLIYALRTWFKKAKEELILASWFLGPIVLTWLVSQVFQSIFFDRYLLYTIPGAMLLLASQRKKASEVLIAILVVVLVIIDFNYFTHPKKLPFREMSSYVKSTTQKGDFLINWYSNGTHHIWETKYYDTPAPIYVSSRDELPFFVGTALMEENDIIGEIPETANRVGVYTSGPVEEINLPGYTEESRKEMNGLKFIWFTMTPE